MRSKILIYLKSGGLTEVLNYILTYIRKMFYYKSETLFYYLDRAEFNLSVKNLDVAYETVTDSVTLEAMDFDRIKTLNYKLWFDQGSQVIVGLYSSKPVSFSWSQFGSYKIQGLGTIILSDNQCWVGPAFVDNSMRGKGILKDTTIFQLNDAPSNVRYYITSANAMNTPSNRSLIRLGFKIGIRETKYFGLLSNKKTKIDYENDGKSLFRFQ